ncbi:MAG TPA: 3-isopropylmalate dehydratase small subunit [Armatimonadota bacterium]|nr:3-isopropylmalate dehydratase small subunit [Armatimonadota bacterium]
MALHGYAHCYGDHIDTDIIIAARYLNTTDPIELAKHCMEDAGDNFAARVQTGDFIVAGENFGCGSSREHAPIAIKASGVSAVISKSFARIFFRNAINVGLPILESPDAVNDAHPGDEFTVELTTGTIHNLTQGKDYQAQPFPEFLRQIIDAGGLVNYVSSHAVKA